MTVNFRKASEAFPATADAPPRRGPGRPRGDSSPRRSSAKSLRKGIDGLIVALNAIIAQLRPADQLDGVEIATLVKAIDEQAKASPKFRRGLESILSATGGTALIPVIGIIAARRLSRHRVIPAAIDPLGSFVLQMMQAEPSEAAAAMDGIMSMVQGVREGASPGDNGRTDTPPAGV